MHLKIEREKIISSSKIKHLEDMKENLAVDLTDSNGNLQTAMGHINSRSATEKHKLERSTRGAYQQVHLAIMGGETVNSEQG
jgi:hypothetical protein